MDKYNAIRSSIFLVAGLVTIIFRKQLNNFKNRMLKKLHFKTKNEKKSYVYMGIIFIIISIVLFVYSITH
jgi:hypothetical protein